MKFHNFYDLYNNGEFVLALARSAGIDNNYPKILAIVPGYDRLCDCVILMLGVR